MPIFELDELADAVTAVGDQLVVGAYPNAQFFAGDVAQDWEWGTNPAHVLTIGRDVGQDRISDLVAAGDLAAAATVPNYGELGGALVLLDPDGTHSEVHRDVVPGHSVTALAYRDGLVYGGTSIHGGIDSTPSDTAARLFVWDVAAGEVVTSIVVDENADVIHSLTFDDAGRLWGLTDNGTLFAYDVTSHEVIRTQATGLPNSNVWGRLSEMYPGTDGQVYGNAGGRLFTFDPDTADFRTFGPTGVRYSRMVEDGTLYFADETNLYSVAPAEPAPVECADTVTGDHRGPLRVTEGITCLTDAEVRGPVTVGAGAGLVVVRDRVDPLRQGLGAADHDDREPLRGRGEHRFVHSRADDHQALHVVPDQRVDVDGQPLRVASAVGQEHAESDVLGGLLDPEGDLGVVGVPQVGDDHADLAGPPLHQGARERVRTVAEFGGRGEDPAARGLADALAAAQRQGDQRFGDPGLGGHVDDRGPARSFAVHGTIIASVRGGPAAGGPWKR